MKFGVNLINFGPSANPARLKSWAQLTEALGFHHLLISDHLAVTRDVATKYPAPFYEPISTLGWLAGVTERVMIGTTVLIVPYRSPLEVAKSFANIDQLSGGRVILGVGAGWAEQEFNALNAPFKNRGAVTDEYIDAIKTLWSQNPASFNGEFVQFDGISSAPAPVQRPHPPIWVGGASGISMRRAVRVGTGWHPVSFRLDWFRNDGVPKLRAFAETAEKLMPDLCPRIRLRITEQPLPEDSRLTGEGTLDQIRADINVLAELGCSHVLLDTYFAEGDPAWNVDSAWRMLTMMAEQVLDVPGGTLR
ncbi:MAG: LLM class F420-dependent oxidoreductase [Alphaproteobacteria bacterium]|jgi:probable F420-dependent oxidoreductase|tara:strand:- start:438 stop:1355 length:918 start_codon:yes stop_codon:yes gene_type:complete